MFVAAGAQGFVGLPVAVAFAALVDSGGPVAAVVDFVPGFADSAAPVVSAAPAVVSVAPVAVSAAPVAVFAVASAVPVVAFAVGFVRAAVALALAVC